MSSFPNLPTIGWRRPTVAVERTVSRWQDGGWQSLGEKLADFRSAHAYVLLGEGGAGKTTAFRSECGRGSDDFAVTARHFIQRDPGSHPEWTGKTLFIDGLDEQRVGGGDPREPLDKILCQLERLRKPHFRLSCREEAWLGKSDLRELSSVANGGEVHLLRLDPLSRDGAREILVALGIQEPDDFLWNVIESGLDAFLQNPLLVEILAKAVAYASAEPWPDTQLAAFDRACRELVEERNKEHLDAQDGLPFSGQEQVVAAGRLCAIVLLSDRLGWSRRAPGDDDYPPLSNAGAPQDLLKSALDTKLFEGSEETGRRPRHRRIAEFLAARYLDKVIRGGLPATRVLALMAGGDGMVVPDLQGVSAWLATMNREARGPLIDTDPIGVAFGGDAGILDCQEVERLLARLERELDYRRIMPYWASIDSLLAGHARTVLWRRLREPDRSEGRQALVGLLLRGLSPLFGSKAGWVRPPRASSAEARDPLLAVVRDATWQHIVRQHALRALIHVLRDDADGPRELFRLLRELPGQISGDVRDELRSELLAFLYPGYLGPAEIWNYMLSSPVPYGMGAAFWTGDLVEKSSPEQLKALLKGLVASQEELLLALAQCGLEVVVFRVLARALDLFGEETEVPELFAWFELVEYDPGRAGLVLAHCEHVVPRSRHFREQKRIYDWLRDHHDTRLALILEGLCRNESLLHNRFLDRVVGDKFLGEDVPGGFRRWCLQQAVGMADKAPLVAIELLRWATAENELWGTALDDDEVVAVIRRVPLLRERRELWLAAEVRRAEGFAREIESPQYSTVRERQARYVASVCKHKAALQAGEGPPEMLHELGRVYVNGLEAGGPDQARADLDLWLGSDQCLVDAVVRGFRCFVGRSVLPSVEDILELHERGMTSLYTLPFLAGLAEDERAGIDILKRLDEAGLRRALAFYLLSRLPTKRYPIPGIFSCTEDCRPEWYRRALRDRPEAVAQVLVAVHRVRVRAKELPDQHLYDMAVKDEYAGVVRLVVPRMVTAFPSSCAGGAQLALLHQVLLAAIRYMPAEELAGLTSKRLDRSGLDLAQQAYWLAAGSLVAPDEHLPHLIDFLMDEKEVRVRHVVDFLVPDREPLPNQEWPTRHLVGLVRAIGSRLHSPWDDVPDSPHHFMGGDSIATGIRAESLVNGWIKTLAYRVDDETSAALVDLADDPALTKWSGKLRRTRDEQIERRRAMTRRTPTVSEVREALQGGAPGSAADLAALVAERLSQLGKRIRNGSTDAWTQYWHTDAEDPKGRMVTEPKLENTCRKVLVSALEPLLELHAVTISQDEQVAEEKHPDIMVHYHTHAVPIEIKKTDSRDLWTAATDQLHGRYSRDPRSDGYGIYLVLWFGADHLKKPPPSGRRPESPGQLRDRLEAELAPQHRLKTKVLVFDVSAPLGHGTRDRPNESGGHSSARGVEIETRDEPRDRKKG